MEHKLFCEENDDTGYLEVTCLCGEFTASTGMVVALGEYENIVDQILVSFENGGLFIAHKADYNSAVPIMKPLSHLDSAGDRRSVGSANFLVLSAQDMSSYIQFYLMGDDGHILMHVITKPSASFTASSTIWGTTPGSSYSTPRVSVPSVRVSRSAVYDPSEYSTKYIASEPAAGWNEYKKYPSEHTSITYPTSKMMSKSRRK